MIETGIPILSNRPAPMGPEYAVGRTEDLFRWAQASALWPLAFGIKCCAIEMMAAFGPRFDMDRFGMFTRATPRQADLLIVAGTVTVKMAPTLRRLWEQMAAPKWCLAMGSCAVSGDHYRNVYSVVPGADYVIPVDVFVPGCPPTPEALMQGAMLLQKRIREGKVADPMSNPLAAETWGTEL